MKTIYCVRHGESEGNVLLRYQTPAEPLSEKGKQQAEFIADRATKLPIEVIIASPAMRTMDTAAAISRKTGISVESTELFAERRTPSVVWGHSIADPRFAEIRDKIFEFQNETYRHSDEENFQDLKKRANAALALLEQRAEDHILVVSHGLFLRTLAARILLGENMSGAEYIQVLRSLRTRNTGLSVFLYKEDADRGVEGPESRWQLLVWNDHAHLG